VEDNILGEEDNGHNKHGRDVTHDDRTDVRCGAEVEDNTHRVDNSNAHDREDNADSNARS